MTSFNTQPRPTRMAVDELRRRTWEMLAAKKHSGAMPSLDTKGQAIFLLLTAGYSVKEIAAGLLISQNFVRVSRRNFTKAIGVKTPKKTATKKEQRQSDVERKRLETIPALSWPIEKLWSVLQQLPPASEAYADDPEMLLALRKAGLNV